MTDGAADTSGAVALDRLRAAYALEVETEGIPVVLALAAATGPLPPALDAAVAADGAGLAGHARSLHAELWPQARQDDLFVTYAVLATVGFADLLDGVGSAHPADELGPGRPVGA